MKKIFSFIILSLSFYTVIAQSPSWQWAKQSEGNPFSSGFGIYTDAKGNSYVAGYVDSSSITFGNITLPKADTGSFFIVKYDSSGNVIWANSAGRMNGGSYGTVIKADSIGNCWVTGSFISKSVQFDSIILINPHPGFENLFVVKYNSLGKVLWAKTDGGWATVTGGTLAIDSKGNSIVMGQLVGDYATFGRFTLSSDSIDGLIGNIYWVKYDPNGNEIWAKSTTGSFSGCSAPTSISIDAKDNCYVTGHFAGTTLYGITFGSYALPCIGGWAIFVVKFDSSGIVQWAKGIGVSEEDFGVGIATDKIGNSYVTGYFTSESLEFGNLPLLYNNSEYNMFIVKYDPSGNAIWAKGTSGGAMGYGVVIDSNGNCYLTGTLYGDSVTFGSHIITIANAGHDAIFVAKYDSSGNALWVKGVGDNTGYGDGGVGIGIDAKNNCYITGEFSGDTVNFDDFTLTNSYTNSEQFFIAKLNAMEGSVTEYPTVLDENNGILVYPNPASNKLFVTLSPNNKEPICQLYSITGQQVWASTIAANTSTFEIPVGNLNSGIYFLKLQTGDGGTFTKKVEVIK